VNYFAWSPSNHRLNISFARNNNLLDKMPFCHLTQYCRSNTAVDIARILKASTSPAGIKYKFGIQVPKGIENTIDLDKKNGNQLWQEAIKTEITQLTDYQTFIVLDSGDDIPTGYQKIPYHKVFDVKYDLIHKARLVAGVNWTVNDKEDIYSEVVRMDTVRIGFFLGELYGLSCCACDIVNAFLYGKTKEKVYITAGPEFGVDLHGKNVIIDKFFNGFFYPDLWMVNKSSHYEYLATYVDDILTWSKDPMAVIKALEKTYVLKSVEISEYY
jgi:hypothetical protein